MSDVRGGEGGGCDSRTARGRPWAGRGASASVQSGQSADAYGRQRRQHSTEREGGRAPTRTARSRSPVTDRAFLRVRDMMEIATTGFVHLVSPLVLTLSTIQFSYKICQWP